MPTGQAGTRHAAKVRKTEPGPPPENAGLKVGDMVLSLDRTQIDNAADFNASVEGRHAGTEVRLRMELPALSPAARGGRVWVALCRGVAILPARRGARASPPEK